MKPLSPWIVAVVAVILASPPLVRAAENPQVAERDLVKIEREWSDAIVHRDADALGRILADEYVLTTPFGQVVTKTQLVASLRIPRADTFVVSGIEQQELSTRVYGDTAICYSRFILKGRAEGRDVSTPFRHTDVFVKRDGRWRCVARQATLIAEPDAAPAAAPGTGPAPAVASQ